ncbi:MAG: serine hydrolase domain-containing protein [Myxococcota bacterium]
MDLVARTVDALIADRAVPSASVAVVVDGRTELVHTAGLARLDPPRPAILDQPYDLASLTKVIAAGTVTAALVDRGALALDAPACRYADGVDPRITVRMLVDHRAGYPAWAPLHRENVGRDAIVDAAIRTPLAAAPGTTHAYSDLGYLVLLRILERVGQDRLDVQLARWVPAIRWGWPEAAATEVDPERGTIEGVVHDPIAFAMGASGLASSAMGSAGSGAVSSHAGAFGTARAVAAFGWDALTGGVPRLPWVGPGPHRGGWDQAVRGGATGAWWPADGVGHLGFTGTSVWIAPRDRVVVAALTNRLHPRDDRTRIREVRAAIADAVAQTLGWDARG